MIETIIKFVTKLLVKFEMRYGRLVVYVCTIILTYILMQ